jgi:hypothetical protein
MTATATNPTDRARFVFWYLNQGQIWFPKDRPQIKIQDMDLDWRRNAANWLVRRSRYFAFMYGIGEFHDLFGRTAKDIFGNTVNIGPTEGSWASDAVERELERRGEEREHNPESWIKTTALYRALVAGLGEAA